MELGTGGSRAWVQRTIKENPHLKLQIQIILAKRTLSQIKRMGEVKRLCERDKAERQGQASAAQPLGQFEV